MEVALPAAEESTVPAPTTKSAGKYLNTRPTPDDYVYIPVELAKLKEDKFDKICIEFKKEINKDDLLTPEQVKGLLDKVEGTVSNEDTGYLNVAGIPPPSTFV